MTKGDRVSFVEEGIGGAQLGTVRSVSPAGYVSIDWDDGTEGRFSPRNRSGLSLVTGDDALPRHDWVRTRLGGSPVEASSNERVVYCDRCGVEQTDENEFEPCREDGL